MKIYGLTRVTQLYVKRIFAVLIAFGLILAVTFQKKIRGWLKTSSQPLEHSAIFQKRFLTLPNTGGALEKVTSGKTIWVTQHTQQKEGCILGPFVVKSVTTNRVYLESERVIQESKLAQWAQSSGFEVTYGVLQQNGPEPEASLPSQNTLSPCPKWVRGASFSHSSWTLKTTQIKKVASRRLVEVVSNTPQVIGVELDPVAEAFVLRPKRPGTALLRFVYHDPPVTIPLEVNVVEASSPGSRPNKIQAKTPKSNNHYQHVVLDWP